MKKFKWVGSLVFVFVCLAFFLFAYSTDEIKADKEALKHISSNTSQNLIQSSVKKEEKKSMRRISSGEKDEWNKLENALENLDIRLDGLDDLIHNSVQEALRSLEDLNFDFDFDFNFDHLDIDLDDLDFDFQLDDFDFDFDFKELSRALEDLDFDFDFDFKWDLDKKSERTEKKKEQAPKNKDLKKIK